HMTRQMNPQHQTPDTSRSFSCCEPELLLEGGSMVTWLCHFIRSFTANFIQRFHVATVYIEVSKALDQHFNSFFKFHSSSHATHGQLAVSSRTVRKQHVPA